MGAGKSLLLLAKARNFKDRGISCTILKSSIDTRDSGVIKSRALDGKVECDIISPSTNIFDFIMEKDLPMWILIDEAQFLTSEQVDQLSDLVDLKGISIICYGLRTDFKTSLFPGSKRLFEVADGLEELKSTCSCGSKASVNARIDESGNIVTEGNQIECGAEDKYITLCRKCYRDDLQVSLG